MAAVIEKTEEGIGTVSFCVIITNLLDVLVMLHKNKEFICITMSNNKALRFMLV